MVIFCISLQQSVTFPVVNFTQNSQPTFEMWRCRGPHQFFCFNFHFCSSFEHCFPIYQHESRLLHVGIIKCITSKSHHTGLHILNVIRNKSAAVTQIRQPFATNCDSAIWRNLRVACVNNSQLLHDDEPRHLNSLNRGVIMG